MINTKLCIALILLLSISALVSCKRRKQSSETKIDNGTYALDAGSAMPGVYNLLIVDNEEASGHCTGAAISDSTIITAAHCLSHKEEIAVCVEKIDFSNACTKTTIQPSEYIKDSSQNDFDVAFVVFQPRTFKYFHPVNFQKVVGVNDDVYMVVFSEREATKKELSKRWGSNPKFCDGRQLKFQARNLL